MEYDSDKIMDSTTVTNSCANTCNANCACTSCTPSCSPPGTNSYCVKDVCGAGCGSNADCTCQQDGCVGADWYDYPDYGTCSDCACGVCTPVITKCDARCMSSCEIQVNTGHDMSPKWGYVYTATDDIWIMATDVSGGACNGMMVDITYWWCSCPSNDPQQIAIETNRSTWTPKYDRLCTSDAAGASNPTRTLACGPCSVKMYHPKFPQDNGVKYWTGVGSRRRDFPDRHTEERRLLLKVVCGCAGMRRAERRPANLIFLIFQVMRLHL